ncbi:MAG: hypothetical protein C0605_16465 [Hyphomicrobiales bacterium]|nr:MAG: hypothetical protein C0605_16465 [Hyphomicrobiales bacterium]
MMKRITVLLALGVMVLIGGQMVAGPVSAKAKSDEETLVLTKEETAEIERINKYLNNIHNLEGDFVQIGPDGGISEGRFYLKRPGRMRFAYKKPNPILVVADGFWIGISNSQLRTTDRIPIRATPIWSLVEKKVDLLKSARIVEVNFEPELWTMTIEDIKKKTNGQLTLVFQGEKPVLKQWIVKDPQGLVTTVSLSNLVVNKRANPRLFIIKDYKVKNLNRTLMDR